MANVIEKSPDAFRSISEVAKMLDIPQHVLRFWESRFDIINPLKRGGNRRFYRPNDVETLRHIRALLYNEGYSIRGVQKLIKEHSGNLSLALSADKTQQAPTQKVNISLQAHHIDQFDALRNELATVSDRLRILLSNSK